MDALVILFSRLIFTLMHFWNVKFLIVIFVALIIEIPIKSDKLHWMTVFSVVPLAVLPMSEML